MSVQVCRWCYSHSSLSTIYQNSFRIDTLRSALFFPRKLVKLPFSHYGTLSRSRYLSHSPFTIVSRPWNGLWLWYSTDSCCFCMCNSGFFIIFTDLQLTCCCFGNNDYIIHIQTRYDSSSTRVFHFWKLKSSAAKFVQSSVLWSTVYCSSMWLFD